VGISGEPPKEKKKTEVNLVDGHWKNWIAYVFELRFISRKGERKGSEKTQEKMGTKKEHKRFAGRRTGLGFLGFSMNGEGKGWGLRSGTYFMGQTRKKDPVGG